jgi:hypothetical protein
VEEGNVITEALLGCFKDGRRDWEPRNEKIANSGVWKRQENGFWTGITSAS